MALSAQLTPISPPYKDSGTGYSYQSFLASFTFDSAYPVGGEALDPALLGLSAIETVAVQNSSSGRKFYYDSANDKLVAQGTGIVTADLGSPDVGAADDVHAAVTDTGEEQTVTTEITDPPTPRVITATSGGTAADIAAVQVTINGTNYDDEVITEDLPVFTENSATTVTGTKAFKTVTSIVIPAHDDTGATTAVGLGNALGLPVELPRNTVTAAYFGGVLETTAPTVTTSASAVESNTVTLDSTLDESAVLVDYYLPEAAGDFSSETVTAVLVGRIA